MYLEAMPKFWSHPITITIDPTVDAWAPHQLLGAFKLATLDHINKVEFAVLDIPPYPISSLVVQKPGINGQSIFSVGKTTGLLDKNVAVKEVVRELSSWHGLRLCAFGKRAMYEDISSNTKSLFFKLSGELRNQIYETYLSSDYIPNNKIDLTNLTPTTVIPGAPIAALLCTCQQVHDELIPSYRDASSALWNRGTTSTMSCSTTIRHANPDEDTPTPMAAFNGTTLTHLSSLEFIVHRIGTHAISSITLNPPGFNGEEIYSISDATGFWIEFEPQDTLECNLDDWQRANSSKHFFAEFYKDIVALAVQEVWEPSASPSEGSK
ncbi:hypothetical protein LTR95_001428 [Oleoguttula sp. CCFEE 5521]